ncbi:MAG TPA: hypothetical protein VGP55_12440 [Chitinophagaceae bacterium]|nr:hypothetical protein [Chitinophagaceae bacterium]
MAHQNQSLQDLQHIKNMMERSSRFISLSGLSGISAGLCALLGASIAHSKISLYHHEHSTLFNEDRGTYIFRTGVYSLINELVLIALLTFVAAFISSFLFTYLRSKKAGIPLWGSTSIRLFWNTIIPLFAGGLFLLRCLQFGQYELIAPGCLIFYGLALVNASKYTLGEVRYLGYGQLILGIINLWMVGYGLYFWAIGFGILHIIYGLLMWFKYERASITSKNE